MTKIDPFYFRKWRKRGLGAAEAARLAIGDKAVQSGELTAEAEYDPEGCICDYSGEQAKYCHACKDDKRRKHEGRRALRPHKCACPTTMQVVVKSADGEYRQSLGGICLNSETDPYLDQCIAELAAEVLHQMAPTPERWMAL